LRSQLHVYKDIRTDFTCAVKAIGQDAIANSFMAYPYDSASLLASETHDPERNTYTYTHNNASPSNSFCSITNAYNIYNANDPENYVFVDAETDIEKAVVLLDLSTLQRNRGDGLFEIFPFYKNQEGQTIICKEVAPDIFLAELSNIPKGGMLKIYFRLKPEIC